MSTEKIIQMAFELGNTIAQSPEVQAMQEMQGKIAQDAEASALINRYQEARIKMDNKMNDGLSIMPEEENHIRIMEQQLNESPLVQELIQVQEKFNNLMQSVYFTLNEGIAGGNCASDCGTCGGGCTM